MHGREEKASCATTGGQRCKTTPLIDDSHEKHTLHAASHNDKRPSGESRSAGTGAAEDDLKATA